MHKKTFSKLLTLSIAVSVLGLVSVTNVLGQTESPPTAAQISNEEPSFTVSPTDNGSNTTTPTDVGDAVTFTATAVDPNLDNYYLAICKTSAVTAGTGTYPTCDGGKWPEANPTSVASGSEATETYTALVGDSESNAWYAFVCDGNGSPGLCSAVGSSDTPFMVNHTGSFGSVIVMDNADTVSTEVYPSANGIYLASVATGATAYNLGLNLVITNNEGIDCVAETAASLAALILGSSPDYTLECDLDDSSIGGGSNPMTADELEGAMGNAAANTDGVITGVSSPGNGTTAITAGTITLNTTDALEPGDTMAFILPASVISDPDTDSSQDTLTMYICSGESDMGGVTTSFDYSADDCTAGGGVELCSSAAVDPTTTAATCTDTTNSIVAPTAHATYDFLVYVEDTHDFPTTGTSGQTFAVSDVAPVLTSYSAGDIGAPAGTLIADSYVTVTNSVTFTDGNGDRDPTSLDMYLFYEGTQTAGCTDDDNDCYNMESISLAAALPAQPSAPTEGCYDSGTTRSTTGTGKTATGADTSITIDCDQTVWFNATPDDDVDYWEMQVYVTDETTTDEDFAIDTSNTVVTAMNAIGVKESGIAYGTVPLDTDSTYDGVTDPGSVTNMENKGNVIIDVLLDGTDMETGTYAGSSCASDTDCIAAAQQEWEDNAADFTWGTGNVLINTAIVGGEVNGCLNHSIDVRDGHTETTTDEAITWEIHIPAIQQSDSYTGTNYFISTTSSCTGGPY